MNDFKYFASFTFDDKKVDIFNLAELNRLIKDFNKKLSNHKIKYLAVPEYGKRTGRLHLHYLLSEDFGFIETGFDRNNVMTYEMPLWIYGISLVKPIYDKRYVTDYITEYLNEHASKIFNNFYYAGGGLMRTPTFDYTNMDFSAIEEKVYRVSDEIQYKYLLVEKECCNKEVTV